MRVKAASILDKLAAALEALGVGWHNATDLTVYCAHPLHDLLKTTLYPLIGVPPASSIHLITARPPILELDLELDARGGQAELRV